jgi:signal transduction histidine kinase
VEGVSGLWRDLTDNVNQLAANLTNQVRAIAEVATAVTRGDLTRSITAEALGELAALKDNINEMIRNLRDTTQKNAEQDWLKTNLAKFTRMLQGERDSRRVEHDPVGDRPARERPARRVLHGRQRGRRAVLDMVASYAFTERKRLSNRFRLREGIVGQVAYEKKRILLTDVPGDYITIGSALGEAPPLNIIVLPVLFEQEVKAVIELASFNRFSETHQSFLDQLTESIGIVLNTIAANMRTEGLLKQSQLLTTELQSQQEELRNTNDRLEQQAATLRQSEELLRQQQEALQQSNDDLEEKARLLELQKREVETKNREVSVAKSALEDKAEQLSLTSRYKSQFLANMSHELRTPLNSLLILSKLLTENPEGNLSGKQKEFAKTIHAAGSDLLALINDILDLSKIESGTVSMEVSSVGFRDLVENMERTFRQIADERKLDFHVEIDPNLPVAMRTDSKRLQQVLRNLLSNAFKFTEQGGVTLQIGSAEGSPLRAGSQWIAMSVTDTGIGIPEEKQRIIFEAFQQADGTTSRKYGGTGLGLSISREIARLLGGEIVVSSAPGRGSTFTLFVPLEPPANHELAAAPSAGPGERRRRGLRPSAGFERLDPPAAPGRHGALGLPGRPPCHRARRPGRPHRRGRRHVRLGAAGTGPGAGLQGPDRHGRRSGPGSRPPLQAPCDHPGHRAARHGRLGAAGPSQARSADAARADPCDFRGRPEEAGHQGRRLRLPGEARRPGRPHGGPQPDEGLHRPAGQEPASRGG